LYAAEDLGRLQQIRSLRQLGFSLEEIRECLGQRKFSPQQVIALHLGRLDEEIELQQRLRARLESIAARYGAAESVSAEEFIQAIEAMTMMEKYFTKEQLQELDQRKGYLSSALSSLNDRERRIFEARRLTDNPATLEDLSSEFGVSRERIRQIEVRAFEKVQKAVQDAAKVAEVH